MRIESLILLNLILTSSKVRCMLLKEALKHDGRSFYGIDRNGYMTFCPCTGRFGNQADNYLGAMAFAKALNRTLILPPWITYKPIPFNTYFRVDKMAEYHRVITMEEFMDTLAPKIWPPEKRISFCTATNSDKNTSNCNTKYSVPFGLLWKYLDVDFVGSEIYDLKIAHPHDIETHGIVQDWQDIYPAKKWPVLAFKISPTKYPVSQETAKLAKYMVWNDEWVEKGQSWIKENIPNGQFIGIHLRNGIDWPLVCITVGKGNQLLSSPQCLGENNEHGNLRKNMCVPSKDTITNQLRSTIKKHKIRSVFVSSDNDFMIPHFTSTLTDINVTFYKIDDKNEVMLNLVILGRSTHFIGNCVSSFTAFVKRERDVQGLPTSFWGFVGLEESKIIESIRSGILLKRDFETL